MENISSKSGVSFISYAANDVIQLVDNGLRFVRRKLIERRTLRALDRLSDAQLRDIGLSDVDLSDISRKLARRF